MQQPDAYMDRVSQVHRFSGHTVQSLEQLLPRGGGKAPVDFPGKGNRRIAQGIVGGIHDQNGFCSPALLNMFGKIRGNRDSCQHRFFTQQPFHFLLGIHIGRHIEFFRIFKETDILPGRTALVLVVHRSRKLADDILPVHQAEQDGITYRQQEQQYQNGTVAPPQILPFFLYDLPEGSAFHVPSPSRRKRIPGRSLGELTCIFMLKVMISVSVPRSLVAR